MIERKIKLVREYKHDGDIDWQVDEYIVSELFCKAIECICEHKSTFYVEATPEQCQELKLENLDWDFANKCLITEDIDSLTEEAANSGYRVTFDKNDKLRVLIPLNEDMANSIGIESKLDSEASKMKEVFKALLDDEEIRKHLTKYIIDVVENKIDSERLVGSDDLQRMAGVVR